MHSVSASSFFRGVSLTASAGENDISQADIYYDGSGAGFLKTEKSSVKIVDEFRPGMIFSTEITSPQDVSQFLLRTDAGSSQVQALSYQYYRVRTSDVSPGEWVASDYLVLISSSVLNYSSPTRRAIKIKAWRVK